MSDINSYSVRPTLSFFIALVLFPIS